MGKFYNKFYLTQIPEWRTHYVDYKNLRHQINVIKGAVLNLARAYVGIKRLTDDSSKIEINLSEMTAESSFWTMILNGATKVEAWYSSHVEHFLEQFHVLTMQAIQLKLLDGYIPFSRKNCTQLERDLTTLNIQKKVHISAFSKPDNSKRLVTGDYAFTPLNKDTTVSDILLRKRSEDGQVAGGEDCFGPSQTESSEGNSSGYDTDCSAWGESQCGEATYYLPQEKADEKAVEKPMENESSIPRTKKNYDYAFLKLRTLTKEDFEESKATQHSFVVDKLIPNPGRIDKRTARHSLKKAFLEFYRGLRLILNYATLNGEAIDRILSKHDKNIEPGLGEPYIANVLSKFSFYRKDAIELLIQETEHVFSGAFGPGKTISRTNKITFVTSNSKPSQCHSFRFGLFIGGSFVLSILCAYLSSLLDLDISTSFKPIFIAYRMLGICLLALWGYGVDLWLWKKYGINYTLILGLDAKHRVRENYVFEVAAVLTLLLISSFLFFLVTRLLFESTVFKWINTLPLVVHPLFAIGLLLVVFLCYSIQTQFSSIKIPFQLLVYSFTKVDHRSIFIADQWSSIIIVLHDLEYFGCYLINDAWSTSSRESCDQKFRWMLPLLSFLPLMWRILQCVRLLTMVKSKREVVNVLKYSCSSLVIVSAFIRQEFNAAAFLYVWSITLSISTIFTMAWDTKTDWNLGERDVNYPKLRQLIIYPVPFYYLVIFLNIFLRLAHHLSLYPEVLGTDVFSNIVLSTALAVIELTRRRFWNLLYTENIHIHNITEFTALRETPLPLPVQNPFGDHQTDSHV